MMTIPKTQNRYFAHGWHELSINDDDNENDNL